MSRLVYFLVFILGLVLVMNVSSYQGETVSNDKFDFQKMADANKAREEEIKKLMNPPKKKKVVKVVKKKPLVELTTPQLELGAQLYKKCIVCHGKRGNGKSAQNAPAIGGQHDWYVEKQITAMQTGERVNKVMMPYINRLSAEDVAALAAYISKLPYMGRD